jgi:hypothetical protein
VTPSQVLRQAAELIEQRGWCQGKYGDAHGDRLAGLEHAVDDLLASRVTWKISIREAQPVHSEELSR